MRTKRVYIAAPYTHPNPARNVSKALEVAEEILERTDWLPFIPHLFHLWDLIYAHPYSFWLDMDLDWMRVCQALVRVGGPSDGGDQDMHSAADLGIPVFLGLEEFVKWTREEA